MIVRMLCTARTPFPPPEQSSTRCTNGRCPVAEQLIALNSQRGFELLLDGRPHAYFQLGHHLQSQEHPTWCGVASMATVLNTMHVERPLLFPPLNMSHVERSLHNMSQRPPGDRYFTQQYLTKHECIERLSGRYNEPGLELDQLADAFRCVGVEARVYYSNETDDDRYRSLFRLAFSPNAYLIVNYLRKQLRQEPVSYGHFVPLGGYNEREDRVLLVEVTRYRYPPVWARAADLIAGLRTISPLGNPRGLVVVKDPSASAPVAISLSSISDARIENANTNLIVCLLLVVCFTVAKLVA